MPEYVLDHHYKGERGRLALMSELLDPMHRRHIVRLGVGPGARTLEVGLDPGWWTQTIAFTAVAGRASKGRLDG